MKQTGKHPALKVAGSLWSYYRFTLTWHWAIFVVAFVGINILLHRLEVEDVNALSDGIWAGSASSPKIFLLVIGILLTPISLASYVSFGITRKHFALGSILLLIGMSFVSAILMTLGYPIERVIYGMIGETADLVHPPLLQSAAEHLLLFVGYFSAGWMIGSGFYRNDWRIGTVICLLALIPIILMEATAESGGLIRFMSYSFDFPAFAPWLELLLQLLIAAIMLAVNYLMLRKVAIRRKLV